MTLLVGLLTIPLASCVKDRTSFGDNDDGNFGSTFLPPPDTTLGPPRPPIVVTSVYLDQDTTIFVGDTLTLVAIVLPNNATNRAVSWASSNTSVATVNNGQVIPRIEGSVVITVTTLDRGLQAFCAVTVKIRPLVVNGTEWAVTNVDEFQTFAAQPDMYTMFYQWNRDRAWPIEGPPPPDWPGNDIWDQEWDTVNPCPDGWRLPTAAEFLALRGEGSSWAPVNTRGNNVPGRFYGPNHATCEISNLTGCIFLPAGGFRYGGDGILYAQSFEGRYWANESTPATVGWRLFFSPSFNETGGSNEKTTAFTLRCVR